VTLVGKRREITFEVFLPTARGYGI